MELCEWKITLGRSGRRRMDRTDRIDLTVKDLMIQSGLHLLGIGSRQCENANWIQISK